ncbi:MAG: hypothetical protein JO021_14150 [Alphaproteobacteria bacterium]|nr:hypothetical protein [Alphaproteobacteria bacterium]
MKRLLCTVALSALVFGVGAPAWAQYSPSLSYNGSGRFDSRGMPLTGDIADQLNGAVAARNDAADAANAAASSYGSSGVPSYAPGAGTTTTTTTWRSVSPDYPPSINDARPSYGPPPYPPPAYPPPAYPPPVYRESFR